MSAQHKTLRLGFVGAGCVNFGGPDCPWDHATRLERLGGVEVVGIADPAVERAKRVLEIRQASTLYGHLYTHCLVYSSAHDMLENVHLDVVFIGTPPSCRGSLEDSKHLELTFIEKGVHVFVEKPLSISPPSVFDEYLKAVMKAQRKHNVVLSVGYMFRYHAAVRKMKELIADHGGKVMAINARYYFAYEEGGNPFWWDVQQSGGPIVEQATHFCDLARYLAGEIILDTVKTTCLRAEDPSGAGVLSKIPPGCDVGVAPKDRVPRITITQWRFQEGGVGCLTHTVALQGTVYEATLDVLLDGMRLTLHDPYSNKCQLRVRDGRTGSDEERVFPFADDDPYMNELRTFLNAAKTRDTSSIESTYEDAAKSYYFTWAIRNAESYN